MLHCSRRMTMLFVIFAMAAAVATAEPPQRASNPWQAMIGRSPFPMPGERIREPLAIQLQPASTPVPSGAATAPAASPAIPWNQAEQHVGKVVTVEGQIVATRNTGEVCFLNFDRDYRGKFYVILFADVLNSWPQPPQTYFKGKTIRVQGEVKMHRGAPQIQVRSADQITVVP